jgi:hypothetical protein
MTNEFIPDPQALALKELACLKKLIQISTPTA